MIVIFQNKNRLRSRSTIEFLGLWEKLNNPDFKLVEFDQFRNDTGNIRDFATLEQLVVLSNLESYNSELIKQKIPAEKRLEQLNKTAIEQMRVLIANKSIKEIGFE